MQRGLLLSGGLALAGAMLAFTPVLPHPALWQFLDRPAAPSKAQSVSPWAGHLENPGTAPPSSGDDAPLTSASYVSGFNTVDAGPLPDTPAKSGLAASGSCPKGLVCTFRPKQNRAAAPVPPVQAAAPPASVTPASQPAAAAHQDEKANGLAALIPRMPHLPSAHAWLAPFTFVADTFGGLVHKL